MHPVALERKLAFYVKKRIRRSLKDEKYLADCGCTVSKPDLYIYNLVVYYGISKNPGFRHSEYIEDLSKVGYDTSCKNCYESSLRKPVDEHLANQWKVCPICVENKPYKDYSPSSFKRDTVLGRCRKCGVKDIDRKKIMRKINRGQIVKPDFCDDCGVMTLKKDLRIENTMVKDENIRFICMRCRKLNLTTTT